MPITEQVKWSPERRQLFGSWIHAELINTMGNRAPLERKWQDNIEQWRAPMPKGTKEFPWPGASNLPFPLTAMHADPVYADFMQTLHAPAEYWSVIANRRDRVGHAHPMTEFLKRVDRSFLNMRDVNSRALMDNNILGTAIYKNHWLHERKEVRDYAAPDGSSSRTVERLVKVRSQPLIEPVPLHYFWIPAEAWNIDPDALGGARWVAQEIWLTKEQLAVRAKSEAPNAPNYDKDATAKALAFEMDKHNQIDARIQKQESFEPWRDQRVRLFEVWARFDTDGDGVEEDIVAIVHLETGLILRALHNPFLHGHRPFERTRYLPTFGFYGLGLAEADEWAQLTAEKLLNATIDNTMIGNTRMFSAPLGYTGGDTVYPGKVWYVGPNEQIGEIRLGDVNPSIFQLQSQIMGWAEKRTGVNELYQGDISGLPSRTPAHTTNQLLQESNKRFDMILSDFRKVHDRMGLVLVQNLAQEYQEDPFTWQRYCKEALGEEDANLVIETLTMSVHDLPDTLGVTVTATSALTNKDAERQQFIGMLQILSQIYGQLVQTAGVMMQAPPGSPVYETAAAAYTSGTELTARLLEKFDIQNPEAYLGNLRNVAQMASQQGAALVAGAPPAMGGIAPPLLDPSQIGAMLGL